MLSNGADCDGQFVAQGSNTLKKRLYCDKAFDAGAAQAMFKLDFCRGRVEWDSNTTGTPYSVHNSDVFQASWN